MAPYHAQEFVNDLINKEDQVTGFRLTFNRFLILFYKCLYLRKRKKISTLFEILLPIACFILILKLSNRILPIDNEIPNANNSNLDFKIFKKIKQSNEKIYFPYNLIYYDYNNNTVDEIALKDLLSNSTERFIFNSFETVELVRAPKNITDNKYFLVNFEVLNSTSINYLISIINDDKRYDSWFIPDLQTPTHIKIILERTPVDRFHEEILKAYSKNLNSKTQKYNVIFDNFDGRSKTNFWNLNNRFRNPNVFIVFPNVLFFSFTFVFHFVLASICEEKLTRSFEFLKLMGASDGEVLFGHLMNHFLIWMIPFFVNMVFFVYFVPTSILPANLLIIFIIFSLLFILHLICFLILLSAPFKKYIFPELLFVIIFFCIVSRTVSENSSSFMNALMIFHPYGSLSALSELGRGTLSSKFTFNENFFTILTYKPPDKLSILHILLLSISFIIIELMLTNYILQVNPFQNGIRKSFIYFLKPDYWFGSSAVTEFTMSDKKEFEKVSSCKKAAIILKNIYKSYSSWLCFGRFQVLKNFNFAIYEKQITVLLGHNGAGKTTTMDLITGLLAADNGSISIRGIAVGPYSSKFKRALGYCPQENIFYEKLTVYENLKIAGILKSVSLNKINKKVSNLAAQFGLESKLNLTAKNLSGGMKRRLCLAIAIIGYNDVLVIDEPTSGLDTQNRRNVWDILLELRKHRTILLTTHFLEEADILGDSIAIMHSGTVKCCGSTMFLKKVYNVGYRLRLELNRKPDEDLLLRLIRNYIPDAKFLDKQANEYFYCLALNEKGTKSNENLNLMIANLFDHFDNENVKQSIGIKSYGLTSTSLEDVFIKIGTLDLPKEEIIIERTQDHPLFNLSRVGGLNLYLQQISAIFKKKLILTFKNFQLFISSIYPLITPTANVILLALLMNFIAKNYHHVFNLSDFKEMVKNTHVLILTNNSFDKETDLFREENRKWLIDEYGFSKFVESNATDIDTAVNQEKIRNGWANFIEKYFLILERNGTYGYKFYLNPFKFPHNLMGSIGIFYRSIVREINPNSDFNVNFKFESLKKVADGSEDGNFETLFAIHTNGALSKIMILISCGIMFGFSFVVFVEILNDEMNSGSLDMQIIAGLSKKIYWFGNLMFDYIFYLIVITISSIFVYCFDTQQILSSHMGSMFIAFALASLNCLLITYFLVNLRMKKEVTDFIIKYSILMTSNIIAIIDVIFYQMSITPEKKKLSGYFFLMVLSPPYNFIEQFFHYYELYSERFCLQLVKNNSCLLLNTRKFDFKYNLLAYLTSISIFIFLIVLINFKIHTVMRCVEYAKVRLFNCTFQRRKKSDEIKNEPTSSNRDLNINYLTNIKDPNIDEERRLAEFLVQSNDFQDNILIVHELVKMFDGFAAVDHLSFTVKKAECFGLLGINGAGKSTTFKMIGGSTIPTSGTIIIDGCTFDSQPYKYYRKLGYCPQENTHTNRITVTDNLKYFARINGIPNHLIKRTVRTLIEECDLVDHKNKFAEKLSGGNKRKLSTAISLIGRKDLILLDEPTTGVDPVARRKLWKTIEFYKKELKTSFILTSHSMDECEQLCNKISIMVSGKLKCLGTFSYLRDKYSQGFTITIKIKEKFNTESYICRLKERMLDDFEGKAKMKEFYMNSIVFIILSKVFNWSHLFRAMEKAKTDLDLEDYLINDTNLEQIFLSFAEKN